jgi:hypothetical protein
MKTSHKSDELKKKEKRGIHKSGTYDIFMALCIIHLDVLYCSVRILTSWNNLHNCNKR